jgi:hypothetical protein
MSNILDIYNTLLRIERNNHIAKRKNVYSKEQISKYYKLKAIELFNVIKRIDMTRPKSITYSITYQLYKNVECYLFTFNISKNKKHHIPNRIFYFHQPIYLLKGEKEKCIIKAINTLKN